MTTEKISRVTVFCDDRRVGLVLRVVAGLVIGNPEVVPVINAEAKNGAVQATTGNGTAATMFAAYIRKHKMAVVRTADARDFLQSIGRSPQSATYVLARCRENGVLRAPTGRGVKTAYKVAK